VIIRKPPRLPPHATLGIVAPSLPLLPGWQEDYQAGKDLLTAWGFELREGATVGLRCWWSAGTPAQQAADLHAMFADPSVHALIALSGGFSAQRVVDLLDFELIGRNPKPLIGMSDITVYQWAMLSHCGLVGFHANNLHDAFGAVVAHMPAHEQARWQQLYVDLLTSAAPLGPLPQLSAWETWQAGVAQGMLLGGCLKRITALIGTAHFPPLALFEGALLFWEEIGESMYDIVLNLHKLKHIGVLDRIGGMVIGQPVWVNEYFSEIEHPPLQEAILDVVAEYDFPILAQVDFGHNRSMLPLPIGITARMDTSAHELALLEAAVE
jgi:muramoyltetrapeptide carboxypeptidase